MRDFVKRLMVATCTGAAAVTIAACGGASAGDPAGAPTSDLPPFTTLAPLAPPAPAPSALPVTGTPGGDFADDNGRGRGGPGRGGGDDRDQDEPHGAVGVTGPPNVTASGVRVTFACGNLAVTISGGDSDITLTGTCQSVTVTADDDTVRLDAVGTITVTGSDDHVTWHSGGAEAAPAVHNSGVHNTVSQG
jgi:hypothetical protein